MIRSLYQKIIPEQRRIKNILLFNKVTSVFYRGNRYACNCCGKSFRKFKSKGNTLVMRKNAECPYCTSLERTRNLLFYLNRETNLFTDKLRLLHFAPEWSLLPLFKNAKNIDYFSADINPNFAEHRVDIMNIPFADESFDFIICAHVLGHVPDEKKAITELYRVLMVDGTALISTIIDLKSSETLERNDTDTSEKRLHYYSEPDLLRLHGKDFGQRLMNGGFNVEKIDYPSFLGNETREKYSLGDGSRELIFKCTKI